SRGTGAGNDAWRAGVHGRRGEAEICRIGEIEELGTELQPLLLGETEILEHTEIPIEQPRAAQDVPAGVADRKSSLRRRRDKTARVEPTLSDRIGQHAAANAIRTRTRAAVAGVACPARRKWITVAGGQDGGGGPSAHHCSHWARGSVPQERYFPDHAGRKDVRRVVIGQPPVRSPIVWIEPVRATVAGVHVDQLGSGESNARREPSREAAFELRLERMIDRIARLLV